MTRQGLYNLDPTRKGFGYGVDGAMTQLRPRARPLLAPRSRRAVVRKGRADRALLRGVQRRGGPLERQAGRPRRGARARPDRPVVCRASPGCKGPRWPWWGWSATAAGCKWPPHFGCTPIVDGLEDWASATDGLGADGVVDAVGISAALEDRHGHRAAQRLDHQGGLGPGAVRPFARPAGAKERHPARGSFSHNWPVWERVLQLLATGLSTSSKIIGGIWPLEEWHDAFEKMHSGQIVKAVLKP